MTAGFWSGKKVFVTGHTGFKGAWLAETLLSFGAQVTGYALPAPYDPSLFSILGLAKRIDHIEADVRDREKVSACIKKAKPDVILHLAAQALVRKSYNDPHETFDTNIMGTVNVLDAARHETQLKSVVVVTSDKCYLNEDTGRFFAEDDKLGGKDPYSASKAAAEIVSQAYYESYYQKTHIAMATARAGNVIGGGDWAEDRLIPDAFRAYVAGKPVMIRNPAATRPWQHVLEPIRGYLMLAEKLYTDSHKYAGGWNFGPEEAGIQSVEKVLTLLQKSFPFDLHLDRAPQPHEAKLLGLDITKAKKGLGWQPQIGLEQSIALTGEWYRAYADKKPADELTRRQIAEYFNIPKAKTAAA